MTEHSLGKYIEALEKAGLIKKYNVSKSSSECLIKNISYNSKDDMTLGLFVCKGAHFKQEYLHEAIEGGAVCYISEVEYHADEKVGSIIVEDIRETMVVLADIFYNKVYEKLSLVGITGTKGKSTTTYFIKYILDEYLSKTGGKESAVLSSIENYDGVIREESHLTTPETLALHKHFSNAVASGIKYLTMEVSSQALKYKRTKGILYDVGAFLNIGEDHISDAEHSDFQDYFDSKLILLNQCKIACINKESDYFEKIMSAAKKGSAKKIVTFGFDEDCDVCGFDLNPGRTGIDFKVKLRGESDKFRISVPGIFNVENALCAVAVADSLGIPKEYIKSGLARAKVAGRMEAFSGVNEKGHEVDVIVDYAHNSMSFETLFKSVKRQYGDKKIGIVYGCPGKKALGRRKELGSISGKYADYVILTEEDAGEEDVLSICKEIAKHVAGQKARCEIEIDRKKAIKNAIEEADENTVVLVTGKGRETRQKRGTVYVDSQSDVDIVVEYFRRTN